MIIKKLGLCALILLFISCSSTQINKTLGTINDALGNGNGLSAEQVAAGLKEALINGITTGSANASKLNGYFKNPRIKIPFPPDVQKVEDKLRQIGLGDQVDKFVMTLNHGAEEAAKEAKPIFVNAIKSMTIQDAWAILKGEEDAATNYLKRVTSSQLKAKFEPVMAKALNKTNATKYYGDVITSYNKIPFVEKVDPDLNDYATSKAVDGLFYLISLEEARIRKDPVARTTELLKKVFAEQD